MKFLGKEIPKLHKNIEAEDMFWKEGKWSVIGKTDEAYFEGR